MVEPSPASGPTASEPPSPAQHSNSNGNGWRPVDLGVFLFCRSLTIWTCSLVFLILLGSKWTASDEALLASQSVPLNPVTAAKVHFSRSPMVPSEAWRNMNWREVIAPLVISDALEVALVLAFLVKMRRSIIACGTLRQHLLEWNKLFGMVDHLFQSSLSLLFKLLLIERLSSGTGSFRTVCWPIYVAMVIRFTVEAYVMHGVNNMPLKLYHCTIVMVAVKLDHVEEFDIPWEQVFWPVWLLFSCVFVAVVVFSFCAPCCLLGLSNSEQWQGLPMYLRTFFGNVALLSVPWLLTIALCLFLTAVKLNQWLDGIKNIRPWSVLAPAIVACVVQLLCLSIVSVCLYLLPHPGNAVDEMMKQAKNERPGALVRKSSTLFARANTATADRFKEKVAALAKAGAEHSMMVAGLTPREATAHDPESGVGSRTMPPPSSSNQQQRLLPTHSISSDAVIGSDFPEPPAGVAGGRSLKGGDSEVMQNGEATQRGSEGVPCFICCSNIADAVFMECGHGGVCHTCAMQCYIKPKHQCPMCRQPIDMVVKIGQWQEDLDGDIVVDVVTPR